MDQVGEVLIAKGTGSWPIPPTTRARPCLTRPNSVSRPLGIVNDKMEQRAGDLHPIRFSADPIRVKHGHELSWFTLHLARRLRPGRYYATIERISNKRVS